MWGFFYVQNFLSISYWGKTGEKEIEVTEEKAPVGKIQIESIEAKAEMSLNFKIYQNQRKLDMHKKKVLSTY